MVHKWIRVEEQTHSDVADVASILNLSGRYTSASMGDAVKVVVKEWLERNRVLYLKRAANEADAAQVGAEN